MLASKCFSSSFDTAIERYVKVNIENTNACMNPSKSIKNATISKLIPKIIPNISVIIEPEIAESQSFEIIEPPNIFPNNLNEIDITLASSPITFNGNNKKNGEKYSFIYSRIPLNLIEEICTYKK